MEDEGEETETESRPAIRTRRSSQPILGIGSGVLEGEAPRILDGVSGAPVLQTPRLTASRLFPHSYKARLRIGEKSCVGSAVSEGMLRSLVVLLCLLYSPIACKSILLYSSFCSPTVPARITSERAITEQVLHGSQSKLYKRKCPTLQIRNDSLIQLLKRG